MEKLSLIGLVIIVLFMVAQGAAVFVTANLGLRLVRTSGRLAKIAAMAISYAGWVAATVAGYALMGGEGGLMDGFGMVIFLCSTALISSFMYLLAWVFWPAAGAAAK